jgi:hypothetical protein
LLSAYSPPQTSRYNLAVSQVRLWPLYIAFDRRYDDVAHRPTRSAGYPCPIQAGSVPPGRLRSCTGLLYRPHQFTLMTRSKVILSRLLGLSELLRVLFGHWFSGSFHDVTRLHNPSISTSRFQDTDIGHSASLHRLYALAAKRLALVSKLPLIEVEQVRPL